MLFRSTSSLARNGYPFYLTALAAGWGGVCVHFQVFAALSEISINKTKFFFARLINGIAASSDTMHNTTTAQLQTVSQENAGSNAPTEDLSYPYLISLGIKCDTDSYNGETTWNAMPDEEKRAAIAYVTQNITNNASKRNTVYASKFLSSNVWKK